MTEREVKPQAYNPYPGLVAGTWYSCIALGSYFLFWVCRPLTRKELRPVAHEFIGKDIYDLEDIERVRKTCQ